jgi:hypothetical protein
VHNITYSYEWKKDAELKEISATDLEENPDIKEEVETKYTMQ